MMATFADFHFLRPLWFLALLPALLLCVTLLRHQRQSQQWMRYISPALLPFLLDQAHGRQRQWPLFALLALWSVAVIALAGPVWQKIPQPVERNTQALVICWDLSPSMLAEDVKPSRLARSRLKLIDLLQTRKEGQVALIAYSGEAYTVTPLTDDRQTIINLLPALSPTTLPTVGSNPEMALSMATQLLKDGGVPRGHILFLTDEIEPSAFQVIGENLRTIPHQVTFWGVGTRDGAPIPLPDGGFAKNRRGEMVVARLNEDQLQKFAADHQAYYIPMLTTNSDIETLEQLLSPSLTDNATRRTDRVFDQWFEHGQYLALLLIPFVAWTFRRGWIFVFFLTVFLPLGYSPQASALSWDDLWLTKDQQAARDLKKGEAEAATRFTTPDRRGAALYEQGDYESAANEFGANSDATNAYNRGNALTQAGQFEEALKAYDQALQQQPDFPEAKQNREIARQLAEMQKQQKQNGSNGENQDGQEDGEKGEQSDSQGGNPGQQSEDSQPGNQSEGEMSDEEAQKAAQRQESEESAAQEENPYAQAEQKQKQNSSGNDELRSVTETEEQANEEGDPLLADTMHKPMTEEEQMLEQWLRKVPDDPSGLLRNKFKYQYMQRRQSLRGGFTDNEAEQRW
ncbi:VWA domain-containing protein [Saccharophagus sp. K07]|uniref:VWA domain-containing protein n=1 Tax=Saccharophagus sp. K07 TaxID=2283636 RepID=UPI00165233B5|nr:VWA domain-containing protein [Saccharophagus sp. K07]MBC6904804.1 VWA domain-containing protein [Saccharophagus sp. K07]